MKTIIKFSFVVLLFPVILSCEKASESTGPYYVMEKLGEIDVVLPNKIHILFQVRDKNDVGVADLTVDKFLVLENDREVGSESKVTIKPTEAVPIQVKTILLLDNSESVETKLEELKAAAIALIDQKPDYQEIMIYTFSGSYEKIQELTSDVDELKAAINGITVGPATTNLHGALVQVASEDIWEEEFSFDLIKTGNLICFTDGDDTQGSVDQIDAINALEDKKVYMLGLGEDMDNITISNMKKFGEFHEAENIDVLTEVFLEIQADIENTAKSYYWLHYQSPKEGDNDHTLKLKIKGNSNGSASGYVQGEFNSAEFSH